MRIWDIHPGYLARQQLLGEHRELHGLFNISHWERRGIQDTLRHYVGLVVLMR
ncbi:MAG: pyrimidine dimer DNA glycosylase/endonuclease V [Ghiorsea sp.]